MALDIATMIQPARTAVVTMEMQGGTLGEQAVLPMLRDIAIAHGVIEAAARLCGAARRAGVRVVHCTVAERGDRAGSKINSRLQAVSVRAAGPGVVPLEIGTPGSAVIPELGPDPADIVIPRMHGVTPFVATSLDQVLRNLGVDTVVAVGVSLNIGVLGLVMNAVDHGYQVVVPTDAVVGVPFEYGETLLANTFAMLATLTTVADITAAWS